MFSEGRRKKSLLDPRTKLFLLIAAAVFAGRCVAILPAAVCTVLLGGLLFAEGEYDTALTGTGSALILFAIFSGAVPGDVSGLSGAIYFGLMMLVRYFCPVMMALLLFTKTTGMGELIAAFQKMRLPVGFVIPFIVMIRFMPTVSDEWSGIRKAMLFRGIEFNFRNMIRSPAAMVEHMMAPLLFSSLSLMDELASSALARGLDSERERSSYVQVRMKAADYITIVLFAAFCVISISLQ